MLIKPITAGLIALCTECYIPSMSVANRAALLVFPNVMRTKWIQFDSETSHFAGIVRCSKQLTIVLQQRHKVMTIGVLAIGHTGTNPSGPVGHQKIFIFTDPLCVNWQSGCT